MCRPQHSHFCPSPVQWQGPRTNDRRLPRCSASAGHLTEADEASLLRGLSALILRRFDRLKLFFPDPGRRLRKRRWRLWRMRNRATCETFDLLGSSLGTCEMFALFGLDSVFACEGHLLDYFHGYHGPPPIPLRLSSVPKVCCTTFV